MVDCDDFDPERRDCSAEQVWQELQTCRPSAADPVVTHGDFSLDNILVDRGLVVGCIDVGRLGLADRYQDLAILARDLRDHEPALELRLFHAYGLTHPEVDRLRFHQLLDELF